MHTGYAGNAVINSCLFNAKVCTTKSLTDLKVSVQ